MRIFDRLRMGEGMPLDADFAPEIIIGDEIAVAVLEGRKPEYPIVAPPFDSFAVEFRPSPWNFMWGKTSATGALVMFNVIRSVMDYRRFLESKVVRERVTSDWADLLLPLWEQLSQDCWLIEVVVEYEFPSYVGPAYSALIGVWKDNGSLMIATSAEDYAMHTKLDELLGISTDEKWGMWSLITNRSLEPSDAEYVAGEAPLETALMVVSLLHCSNVKPIVEVPPMQRQERRRMERAGHKPIEYKRLTVKPHSSRSGTGSSDESGEGMAIHLVRGHFKTYTPERPLLGKYSGTYWWQPMVRGTEKRVVVKDYEVEEA